MMKWRLYVNDASRERLVFRLFSGHNLIGHSSINNTPNTSTEPQAGGPRPPGAASSTEKSVTIQSPAGGTPRAAGDPDPLSNPIVSRFCQALINKKKTELTPGAVGTPATVETQLLSPTTPSNDEAITSPASGGGGAGVTELDVLLPQRSDRLPAPNRRKVSRRRIARLRDWWRGVWERDWTLSSVQVDRISMLMFPIAFGAFNLCYWCIYFLKMDRPM